MLWFFLDREIENLLIASNKKRQRKSTFGGIVVETGVIAQTKILFNSEFFIYFTLSFAFYGSVFSEDFNILSSF